MWLPGGDILIAHGKRWNRAMTIQSRLTANDADLVHGLRSVAETLPSPDAPDFADAFERFGDARVVLLGEATHGTHEFYAAR
ncbi:hypothetical protein LK12_23405, partial [Novosphingobium malaysiense]